MNNKPLWQPSQEYIESTRLYQLMEQLGYFDNRNILVENYKDYI